MYRCRKCRRLLATQQNVVQVEAGAGSAAFPFQKRSFGGAAAAATEDSCVFVEPMQWMQHAIEGQVQGKLYCPK